MATENPDRKLNVRPGTWDYSILENVFSGEYGDIDFRDKTIIDVGAHIGAFSILAGLGGARRVLAFEAGPGNYEMLVRNCRDSGVVECHLAAVWRSDTGPGMLQWRNCANGENTGGGGVVNCALKAGELLSDENSFAVRQIPFDEIVARIGQVDLLKIDAEGSEYPILFTSRRLAQVREIVGEYHEISGLDETMNIPGFPEWNIGRLVAHLEGNGFTVTLLDKGQLGLFHAVR